MVTIKTNKRIALATKLAMGFGVLILILASVTVGIFFATDKVKERALHAQQESSVFAIRAKDMKIHVVQVQQFLSDISATRALDGYDDGFDKAEQHAQEFVTDLNTFQEMFSREGDHDALREMEKIGRAFSVYYQTGKQMAKAYVSGGPAEGNQLMAKFDEGATELVAMLNPFVDAQVTELGDSMSTICASAQALLTGSLLAGVGSLFVGVIVAVVIIRSITRPVGRVIESLSAGAEQTSSAAGQVSSGAQSLAQGASEQAAAVEETTSSLEEMTSMIKQNADNAGQAKKLASQAQSATDNGLAAMSKMAKAIDEIKSSSDETATVMKTIDEIAFQTNLLALNAAVEAARAGDAGKGFAVVAEEVRNLARRSAEASKKTATMIEEAVKNADNGVQISQEVSKALEDIASGNRSVNDLVAEIAAASSEQARGIEQINTAVSQMDQVTQSNAANAEESSAAAEELSSQSETINEIVRELAALIEGSSKINQFGGHFGHTGVKHQHHSAGGQTPEAKKSAKPWRGKSEGKSSAYWPQLEFGSEGADRRGGASTTEQNRAKPEAVIPMVPGKSMEEF